MTDDYVSVRLSHLLRECSVGAIVRDGADSLMVVQDIRTWDRPGDDPMEREIRYVLFDARRGRVYGACYDVGPDGAVEAIAPHGGTIVDVINGRAPRQAVFVGDGAVEHRALIGAAGYRLGPPDRGVPGADGVLCCCDWVAVDAATWEPDYVREWRPG